MMLFVWLAACMSASTSTARAQDPLPSVAFNVARQGPAITVLASATVQADRAVVWRTLVDYTRLPDFIPDMRVSELLQRRGDDVLLRQVGRAGFGPFTRGFTLTLMVHEVPMREISAHAIDGDFQRFESSYQISGSDGSATTRIDFSASMEPKGGIPPLVGMPLIRELMHRQFDALLAEMNRRAQPKQSSVPAISYCSPLAAPSRRTR
jgi:ribosome-associated toxin RatA of RatAB toxin-antitoxin module